MREEIKGALKFAVNSFTTSSEATKNLYIPARIPASRTIVYVSASLKDKEISPAVLLNLSTVVRGVNRVGLDSRYLGLTRVPNRPLLDEEPY